MGQAAVQRCNATVTFDSRDKPIYPLTVNNELHKLFERVASDMLGAARVKDAQPTVGAEDLLFYQESIPGYYFLLGMKDEKLEKPAALHSPYLCLNEGVLPVGAAPHASLAVRYLLGRQMGSSGYNAYLHDGL